MKVDRALIVGVLTHNLGLKALALLMAVISWYMIRDAISFEVEIPDIRLQIQAPGGMAILNQSASTVDVTFRGSQDDIQRLDPRQIQAVLDLPLRNDALTEERALTPEMIKGARGVRPIAINPAKVRITLDRESEKRVPVQARTVGQPLQGQVESAVCEPASVILRGPAARLRTTETVFTHPVDVDGRIESFTRRAPLIQPSESWAAVLEPAEVLVKVAIAGISSSRQVTQVPVMAIVEPNHPLRLEITPPMVDVQLTGQSNDLDSIDARRVRVFADCTGLAAPATYTLAVKVHFPSGKAAAAIARPETVQVTLQAP